MAGSDSPVVFEPIFKERIWGGHNFAASFGKKLPANKRIGESWEIVDRPEAQSIVREGPLAGRSLHDLWINFREELFGGVPDAPRFPLLIKLLDAQEKLSLQVHPPPEIAESLGGEAKTEFWYVFAAEPNAEIFVGLRKSMTRDQFEDALHSGTVADCVHAIRMKNGDAMFLPSGRFHAIGAGNILVEVQQNSDTTYRVFDWNRVDDQGQGDNFMWIRRCNASISMTWLPNRLHQVVNYWCDMNFSKCRNGVSMLSGRSRRSGNLPLFCA